MENSLQELAAALDARLRDFVDRQPVHDFYDLTRHQMGWGRDAEDLVRRHLHGIVCLLASEAAGGAVERAMPLAMAIDLLHNFQLVQEDLELERAEAGGRPTVWAKWGRAQSMNAGDGLHALAKMALLEARGSVSEKAILELEQALDECCLALCEAKERHLSGHAAEEAQDVLFACAAAGGASIAGAPADLVDALRQFAPGLAAALSPL